jgi:hypothetical protein
MKFTKAERLIYYIIKKNNYISIYTINKISKRSLSKLKYYTYIYRLNKKIDKKITKKGKYYILDVNKIDTENSYKINDNLYVHKKIEYAYINNKAEKLEHNLHYILKILSYYKNLNIKTNEIIKIVNKTNNVDEYHIKQMNVYICNIRKKIGKNLLVRSKINGENYIMLKSE